MPIILLLLAITAFAVGIYPESVSDVQSSLEDLRAVIPLVEQINDVVKQAITTSVG